MTIIVKNLKKFFLPNFIIRLGLFSLLSILFYLNAWSQNLLINNINIWSQDDSTKIILGYVSSSKNEKSSKIKCKSFILTDPDRLVIDLLDARLVKKNTNINDHNWEATPIKKVRSSSSNNTLRLVFDLNSSINYKITIADNSLIINIKTKIITTKISKIAPKETTKETVKLIARDQKTSSFNKDVAKSFRALESKNIPRKFIVLIDPGHGGDDPGAVGLFGTKEKDVALQISKYLKEYIDEDDNIKAILTRDNDYYISLRTRTRIARQHQADLFVSVHADGFKDAKAHGSSVFVLSERGASSELAKWIAAHENASDLVGGVSLDNKDQVLASVLLDLSQTASNRSSMQVANKVLAQIGQITDLHKNNVEKAGFVVLKSPDIPSILVETGFISNPSGERNLRSANYQRKIAYAIYKGIQNYFRSQPKSVIPNWANKQLLQANRL